MSTRIWNLQHLTEMMGDETADNEAAAMKDLLTEHAWLDWISDRNGGVLTDIPDAEWQRLCEQAYRIADAAVGPIRVGALVWNTTDTNDTRTVIRGDALRLAEGEIVMESENTGYLTIGVLTGRTRKFWGMDCPTIQRYEIDTVVINGAIWGVRGTPISGTFAVRPDYLTEGGN